MWSLCPCRPRGQPATVCLHLWAVVRPPHSTTSPFCLHGGSLCQGCPARASPCLLTSALPLHRAWQSRGLLPTETVVAALAGPRHRYHPSPPCRGRCAQAPPFSAAVCFLGEGACRVDLWLCTWAVPCVLEPCWAGHVAVRAGPRCRQVPMAGSVLCPCHLGSQIQKSEFSVLMPMPVLTFSRPVCSHVTALA